MEFSIKSIFRLIILRLGSDLSRLWQDANSKLAELHNEIRRRQDNPEGVSWPVFLFGCQRSGTNMVVSALARSWKVELYNEDNLLAFDKSLFLRDTGTVKNLINSSSARVVLFKPIMDTYHANEILREIPGSKGIFIFRDYNDVVNSLVNTAVPLRAAVKYFEFFLSKTVPARKSIINDLRSYAFNFESLLALFWYIQNSFYFDLNIKDNINIKLINYEDIVHSPDRYMKDLCNFINIDYMPQMINNIHTKSHHKNPPPLIAKEVKEACEDLFWQLKALQS